MTTAALWPGPTRQRCRSAHPVAAGLEPLADRAGQVRVGDGVEQHRAGVAHEAAKTRSAITAGADHADHRVENVQPRSPAAERPTIASIEVAASART